MRPVLFSGKENKTERRLSVLFSGKENKTERRLSVEHQGIKNHPVLRRKGQVQPAPQPLARMIADTSPPF